jgi:hypothetical protein
LRSFLQPDPHAERMQTRILKSNVDLFANA